MGVRCVPTDAASDLVWVYVLVALLLGELVLVTLALLDGSRVLWLLALLLGVIIVVLTLVFGMPLLTRQVGT